MTEELKNRYRLILVLAALGVLCALGAFIFRGVLREHVMPRVVRGLYADDVQQHFEEDFKPVSEQLAAYEFAFPSTAGSSEAATCHTHAYEGLSATYACSKSQWSNEIVPDEAYKERWKKEAQNLESYLLSHGWVKTWNERQPIHELFRDRTDTTTIGVNYIKPHGKLTCRLEIWLNPAVAHANPPSPPSLRASEECYRYAEIFGGH